MSSRSWLTLHAKVASRAPTTRRCALRVRHERGCDNVHLCRCLRVIIAEIAHCVTPLLDELVCSITVCVCPLVLLRCARMLTRIVVPEVGWRAHHR